MKRKEKKRKKRKRFKSSYNPIFFMKMKNKHIPFTFVQLKKEKRENTWERERDHLISRFIVASDPFKMFVYMHCQVFCSILYIYIFILIQTLYGLVANLYNKFTYILYKYINICISLLFNSFFSFRCFEWDILFLAKTENFYSIL